jgi:hypothetical protein
MTNRLHGMNRSGLSETSLDGSGAVHGFSQEDFTMLTHLQPPQLAAIRAALGPQVQHFCVALGRRR